MGSEGCVISSCLCWLQPAVIARRPAAPASCLNPLSADHSNSCLSAVFLSQVKDLLPDFGDGYVAACLQQLGGSPERVLNALLEGSLPPQLAQLDTQLSFAAWQAAAPTAAGASAGDGGKGKAPAVPTYDSEFPAALPGAGPSGSGSSSTAEALARAARAENKTAR